VATHDGIPEDREEHCPEHRRLDDGEGVGVGRVGDWAIERHGRRAGEDRLDAGVHRRDGRVEREGRLGTAHREDRDPEDADGQQHPVASHGQSGERPRADQARGHDA
jgi:hypothetical protein